MRSSREMRREAWGIMKGKWFWRLLLVALLLQAIAYTANLLVSQAFAAMSITEVGDFARAKIAAAQQGLGYSLPTTKAYCWMVGGFCYQMFITYIFAAIFSFGFMGLLLKARSDDDTRWFADAFGGFSRPLDVTWLLVLMNLRVFLAMAPCLLLGVIAVGALAASGVVRSGAVLTLISVLAACASVVFALRAVYAYRQAWFMKSEKPESTASWCLKESRTMMKGHKMQAFELDLSFAGWLLLALAMYFASVAFGVSAPHFGSVAYALSFGFGAVFFYLLVKVLLGMAVSRAVFYRDLQGEAAEGTTEGEV